jgi:uncharacterized membrane protein
MESRRWVNQSQPQTLYLATVLSYLNAAFALLFFGSSPLFYFTLVPGLLLLGAQVAGAYGIANEQRWGYLVAVVVSALALVPFVVFLASEGLGELLSPRFLLAALFPVALFALLIHPMSREYQRIWFR